jgi:hypothetical protein
MRNFILAAIINGKKLYYMRCPALGVSVAFFKQPALPGKAPQTKNISKKYKSFNKTSKINQK